MKRWLRTILLILSALVFLGSATALILYYLDSREQTQAYNDLASLHQAVTLPTAGQEELDPTAPSAEPASPWVTVLDPETGESVELLPELAQLYLLNKQDRGM